MEGIITAWEKRIQTRDIRDIRDSRDRKGALLLRPWSP